jgi:vitamin B12 transporter
MCHSAHRQVAMLLVAIVSATSAATAQSTSRDSSRAQTLPRVVTTASRYTAAADSLPRKVEVITRAMIDATPANDVVDVLKKRASLDVVQYPGLLAGIGIRGFRPQVGSIQQRALILLDGRPSGITNLGMLDLHDIERIEVIKGPASSLYGSTAMGGAVNVVTRRRTGVRSGQLSVAGGSFDATDVRVQGGGSLIAGLDGDLSVRRFDQRSDFRVGDGGVLRELLGRDSALKSYAGGTSPSRWVADTLGNGVTRRYTTLSSTSGTARVGGTVINRVRVDLRGDVFDARDVATPGDLFAAGSPFPGDGRKDVRRLGSSVDLSGISGAHTVLARAFFTDETSDFYDRPDSVRYVSFASVARTTGAQLQDVIRLGGQQLIVGADFTNQDATSRAFFSATSEGAPFSPNSAVQSLAGFAEARVRALDGRVIGTLGGRVDRITLELFETPLRTDITPGTSDFTVFNPNAGVSFAATNTVRLHGSIGRAFLAPDAFGRAGIVRQADFSRPGVASLDFGNPELRAEQSVTHDVGIAIGSRDRAFDADVTYFGTSVRDRQSRARVSFPATALPALADGTRISRLATAVNAGDASIQGFEVATRWTMGARAQRGSSVTLTINATHLLTATETTPSVTVDAARLGTGANFSPTALFQATRIGPPNTEVRIKNVATTTANLGVEYASRGRFTAGLLTRYVGTRLDDDFSDFSDVSNIEYPPFAVADLTAGVRLTRRVRADAQLTNVTNENYYEKRGYNLPGRAWQLRVTTTF